MEKAKIPGGYIILSRKIIESEIMKKPPLYMKVWIYLLARAQHFQYNQLQRGQLRTSIPEIQEACSWYVGYRKVTPTKREIQNILDWMRGKSRKPDEQSTNVTENSPMISTTKVTHGMIVTIENYDIYQTASNYERYTERSNEQTNEVSMNSQATFQYKQECINNEQKDINNNPADEPLPDPFEEELTEEQKLENEVKEYYETKLGRFSRPEDWRIIHKAITEEKFTRDELMQGISLAFSLNPNNINSFSYCLKVARTEREKRRKAQQKKKIVPLNRRTGKPDELPMVLRPEFQQQQNQLSPEEAEARVKALKEKIRQLNHKAPKVGEH